VGGFNIDDFTLTNWANAPSIIPVAKRSRNYSGKFLRGPIPLEWLQKASSLPGKTLSIGIVIWFFCGLTNAKTVKLSRAIVDSFGIPRTTAYRLLNNLAQAGLISQEKRPGRSPIITILDVPKAGDTCTAASSQ
jgi:hypothetical protein